MDVSSIAALPQPRPVAGRRSLALISLAALAAIGFFVSVALPYLALDPRVSHGGLLGRVQLALRVSFLRERSCSVNRRRERA